MMYIDYYLRTQSLEQFKSDMLKINIEVELDNNYFQNEEMAIDWIGLIPINLDSNEQINKNGYFVNIRSKIPIDLSLFDSTVQVYPDSPFRVFI